MQEPQSLDEFIEHAALSAWKNGTCKITIASPVLKNNGSEYYFCLFFECGKTSFTSDFYRIDKHGEENKVINEQTGKIKKILESYMLGCTNSLLEISINAPQMQLFKAAEMLNVSEDYLQKQTGGNNYGIGCESTDKVLPASKIYAIATGPVKKNTTRRHTAGTKTNGNGTKTNGNNTCGLGMSNREFLDKVMEYAAKQQNKSGSS